MSDITHTQSSAKQPTSFADAVSSGSSAHDLGHYVVQRVDDFSKGEDVVLDFLTREAVGQFCTALGIKRNWAELDLDEIAPVGDDGINAVPEVEGRTILDVIDHLIENKTLEPTNAGEPQPDVVNDFLDTHGKRRGAPTLGHTWEFSYALGVELEHGRDRGMNVTMNHPLLTGLVVLAHLTEDRLYYARLRVMEAEGELFNLQLQKADADKQLEAVTKVEQGRAYLAQRVQEKLQA